MKKEICEKVLQTGGISKSRLLVFAWTENNLKTEVFGNDSVSCDFHDRVFLKHNSKMTADCRVFEFHRRSVNGKHQIRLRLGVDGRYQKVNGYPYRLEQVNTTLWNFFLFEQIFNVQITSNICVSESPNTRSCWISHISFCGVRCLTSKRIFQE